MTNEKVSLLIPSCNEKFLLRTIQEIQAKAQGDYDIIVYLDGYWPVPMIPDDPKTIIIHSNRQGMNNAINCMVNVSQSKYIMKLDAHCALDDGFDIKLKADCESNWLVVPRRYDLVEETWTRGNKITDWMYLSPPLEKPTNPDEISKEGYWERGFHGRRWSGYNKPTRKDPIEDLMSFQGSAWFMHRQHFLDIGGYDLGQTCSFFHEAQHLGCKTWLSGGRVIRNKKTWYAHLHKGKKHGRGYYIARGDRTIEARKAISFWMSDIWHKQKYSMKWLINKFAPVPEWEGFDWNKKWE